MRVTVGESTTTQIFLTVRAPDEAESAQVDGQCAFLEHVVRDEDYATGFRQQTALKNGGRKQVLFGRNEGGAQLFHQWVDRLIAADDDGLEQLFASG